MNDESLKQKLLSRGVLAENDAEEAQQYARSRRRPFAEVVVELGHASEGDVYRAIATLSGMTFVDPGTANVPESLTEVVKAAHDGGVRLYLANLDMCSPRLGIWPRTLNSPRP